MSLLGFLLLSSVYHEKGDRSPEKTHLTFLPSQSAEGAAPQFEEPVALGCFAVRPFPLTHPFMQSLTKPFNRRGDQWKGLVSPGNTVSRMTFFFGFAISSLESPASVKSRRRGEETCLGCSRLPAGVCGRVGYSPVVDWGPIAGSGPAGWKGQGRSGSRVPGC